MIIAACSYDVSFEDCAVHCATNAECPVDLTCGPEGLCRTPDTAETCAQVLGTSTSCAGLAPTCGPNGDENCCAIATPIPGGTFFRSYDVAADGMYPSTIYPATVSPFVLDRYEVTVGRFRKFVEAGMGTRANPPPTGAGSRRLNGLDGQGGWDASWNGSLAADTAALIGAVKCDGSFQSWTDAAGANEELPINCITWYEAHAFCAWDGGFLPSEAEWNYAAAGGEEQRAYPWSSPAGAATIDCSYANYAYCANPQAGVSAINRVGTESPKGDGKWGQADLAGNVHEWVLDWYETPYDIPCADCTAQPATADRVFRGGSFGILAPLLRTSRRLRVVPNHRTFEISLRCARVRR